VEQRAAREQVRARPEVGPLVQPGLARARVGLVVDAVALPADLRRARGLERGRIDEALSALLFRLRLRPAAPGGVRFARTVAGLAGELYASPLP
jgi:hypothetical protein